MALFSDVEAEQRVKERLQGLSSVPLDAFWDAAFADCPAPDLALVNLERWLQATSSPGAYLEHLAAAPGIAGVLMLLLGASQPVADSLIQNPELAGMVLDPAELAKRPSVQGVLNEGRRLLSASTSRSHSLDRLRFIKQRWMLAITVNDLSGAWEQEVVWGALSDLADGLIALAAEVVFSGTPPPTPPRPETERGESIAIVAFGKLGGRELNYSSDVDLAFVSQDGLGEEQENRARRASEAFARALSDRMGRGSLYRVDLRLRPFGGAGEVVRSMAAVEAYYERYAEPWEVQALLRSRMITGGLKERWAALVETTCFKARTSEFVIDEMLRMRGRIEERARQDDLKRGAGGIRDVEFLVQILQMLHGHANPDVRTPSTCDALRRLAESGAIERGAAEELIGGYTFLRKLEHRCQLLGDQQTHALPSSERSRAMIAHLMGHARVDALLADIEGNRSRISGHFERIFAKTDDGGRAALVGGLGPLAHSIQGWLDLLPESGAFYQSLIENEGSLDRAKTIARTAPMLLGALKDSVTVTEKVLSGEILEETNTPDSINRLSPSDSLEQLAKTAMTGRTSLLAKWAIEPDFDLGRALSDLQDALVVQAMDRLDVGFDLVALGSYGVRELGIESDADVLLMVEDEAKYQEAEQQAQNFLALMSGLRRQGFVPELDLRLRPQGRKGLLVRTYEGLKSYELEEMEMWERFALGQCRLVHGKQAAADLTLHCAYALPVTPERLQELVAMKHRIETERVQPQHWKRHIKLGHGGLSDIEWFVHLNEMRFPTAARVAVDIGFEERIRRLDQAKLINALERDELLQARKHLLTTRHWITLLAFEHDIVPENPDKLDALGHAGGFTDGTDFLRRHTEVIDAVRAIYTDGLERLKA